MRLRVAVAHQFFLNQIQRFQFIDYILMKIFGHFAQEIVIVPDAVFSQIDIVLAGKQEHPSLKNFGDDTIVLNHCAGVNVKFPVKNLNLVV